MQQTILKLSIGFFFISGLAACNAPEDKKAAEIEKQDSSTKKVTEPVKTLITRDDCAGVGNLTVSEDTAKRMMHTYDSIYRKAGTSSERKNLTKSVWIDGMLIGSLADFLESPQGNNYDGVRFMNTVAAANKETTVHIVPTLKDQAGTANKHLNDWGTGKFSLRNGNPLKFINFNTKKNVAETLMDNFDNLYRTELGVPLEKNPLSKGVWISKCVFLSLRDLIDIPSENLDGINVYMGAYNHFIIPAIPGQFNQFQSTIILVPTSPNSSSANIHEPRWDVIKTQTSWNKDAGYNHGALCPNQCN